MTDTVPIITPSRWLAEWKAIGGKYTRSASDLIAGVDFIPPYPGKLSDAACREVARLTWLRTQPPLRAMLSDYIRNLPVEF